MNGMSFELVVSQQILSVRTQLTPISGRQQADGVYHQPSDIPAPVAKDYALRAVELSDVANPLRSYGAQRDGTLHSAEKDKHYSGLTSHLYVRDSVASYNPSSGYSAALFGLPAPLYGITPDQRYS